MYEVNLYVKDDVHYVKVSESDLEDLREGLDDDTAPNYIEVYCLDNDSTFAINRKKVVAYSYREVGE